MCRLPQLFDTFFRSRAQALVHIMRERGTKKLHNDRYVQEYVLEQLLGHIKLQKIAT